MIARFAGVAVLALATGASAGSLDARLVGADTPWVLHIDFEALSRSALLRSLHEAGHHFEREFDADRIQSTFGLDPFVDIRSVTLYGSRGRDAGIAAVAIGSSKLDAAWRRLAATSRAVRISGRDVLQGGTTDSFPYVCLLPAHEGAVRVAVLASNSTALEHALLVIDGHARNLASAQQSISTSTRDAARAPVIRAKPTIGSLVFAASSVADPALDQTGFFARGLQILCELTAIEREDKRAFTALVRGLEFDLSEARGEVAIRLAVDAPNASGADELEVLLRAAFARAPSNGTPGVEQRRASLFEPLRIESPAARVLVDYRYGAVKLVEDILLVEKGGATTVGG